MERIETTILKNLIVNEEYSRKVLPFIKGEYFESLHEKVTFEEIAKFIIEYNNLPTKEAIIILSLIHISEPTRTRLIAYAVFCLKKKYEYEK